MDTSPELEGYEPDAEPEERSLPIPITWPKIPRGRLTPAILKRITPLVQIARRHGTPIRVIAEQTGLDQATVNQILETDTRKTPITSIETHRILHLARYEEILSDLMPQHKDGNLFATQQLLVVLAKIEKLLGLAAPAKVELGGVIEHDIKFAPSQLVRDQLSSMAGRIDAMSKRAELVAADPEVVEGEIVDEPIADQTADG